MQRCHSPTVSFVVTSCPSKQPSGLNQTYSTSLVSKNVETCHSIFICNTDIHCTFQQRILCITRTVKHNYILPISTVRIQLHVSVLYVDHLQVEIFNLQISYTRCVGHLGGRGDEISLFQLWVP